MKTLLCLTSLVVCFNLHLAIYKPPTTTTPDIYKPPATTHKPYKPLLPPEAITKKLLDTWQNPRPSLKKKTTLAIDQYSVWTSLTLHVPVGTKLQTTNLKRFCKCRDLPGIDKRSLVTRVKRMPHNGRVRKEWRSMSSKMRQSFITHFNNLAVQQSGEQKSRLRVFADFHRKSESPGAHDGPAFLSWHREFLYRLENILVADGYKGALPYWNSGLDHYLPKPEESAIFTAKELGTSNGKMRRPFRNTITGDCVQRSGASEQTVERYAGTEHKDNLFHKGKVTDLPWTAAYATFASALEVSHNGVHWWFGDGSHMRSLSCVGFDPIFYMHHTYIDYLWEKYREKQTLKDRENDYPTEMNVKLAHWKYATMWPFDSLENINGLANQYTNTFYNYEKSPDKCKTDMSCGKSGLLWCNNRLCQGKIRNGGECVQRLGGSQCYCQKGNPRCRQGRCHCN